MTNIEQQQTYAMLARNYLKAAEAARRPSFDDFHRAHQAEWAARQALTGDQTALAEVIVGMAEEVALLREWYAADQEMDAAEAELRTPPSPGEIRSNGAFGQAQRRKWAAEEAIRAALKGTNDEA